MRLLPLSIALLSLLAGPLRASDDWLALAVPSPLAKPIELSLGLHQAQRETWARGAGFAWMTDADGVIKEQRLIQGELGLRWQAGPHWGLSLAVPGVFAELAPFAPAGSVINFLPGDPSLRRSQGLGDLRLGLRLQTGAAGAFTQGLLLEGTAPSGLGPFEAPQPLAATGDGRWSAALGWLLALRRGAWHAHLDLRGQWQFERPSVMPAGAPVSYDAGGPVSWPQAGPVLLDGRLGLSAALGLGWDWHVTDDERQSVVLVLRARQQEPLRVDGLPIGGRSQSLALQPELQARYGAFNALLGWQSPYLYADETPAADWGELQLRLDYAL